MAPAAISDAGRITPINKLGGRGSDHTHHSSPPLLLFLKKKLFASSSFFFFLEQKIDSSLWELDL
jgi:hypothetical protein